MKNSVIEIGNFSYFPDKIVGQGATGSVFLGIFIFTEVSGIRTGFQLLSR